MGFREDIMPGMKINEFELNYEDHGQGEAIVFLHGFTGSGQDWRYQLNGLRGKYRGITLDFRGHGKSEAPEEEKDYSIYLNSEDVLGLLP